MGWGRGGWREEAGRGRGDFAVQSEFVHWVAFRCR